MHESGGAFTLELVLLLSSFPQSKAVIALAISSISETMASRRVVMPTIKPSTIMVAIRISSIVMMNARSSRHNCLMSAMIASLQDGP